MLWGLAVLAAVACAWPQESCTGYPDIASVPADLVNPPMLNDTSPAAGLRVRQTHPAYAQTKVYHSLLLPETWAANHTAKYPMLVEFTGNGPFSDQYGDSCTGLPEGAKLGYGIDAGQHFIWLVLPFLTADMGPNTAVQTYWWGCENAEPPRGRCAAGADYDPTPTVNYTMATVKWVASVYGGDLSRVLLAGFSRGAIATGFMGLHNDAIADLWAGFIPYAHYDGQQEWPYTGSDPASALARINRIGLRPSFVVAECNLATAATQAYVNSTGVRDRGATFDFVSTGFHNHNDGWTLRPSQARSQLRAWVSKFLKS